MVEINWLAVLLATIASMIVGSIWYMPPAFGKVWMKLAKLNQKDMEKRGWTPIGVSIATSAVMAFVLAHFTYLAYQFYQSDYSFMATAFITAFWAWLGFTGLRFLTHDSFEGRPWKLTVLNAAHELVTLLAMALVIGLIGL
jgi:hypothetical protein